MVFILDLSNSIRFDIISPYYNMQKLTNLLLLSKNSPILFDL